MAIAVFRLCSNRCAQKANHGIVWKFDGLASGFFLVLFEGRYTHENLLRDIRVAMLRILVVCRPAKISTSEKI